MWGALRRGGRRDCMALPGFEKNSKKVEAVGRVDAPCRCPRRLCATRVGGDHNGSAIVIVRSGRHGLRVGQGCGKLGGDAGDGLIGPNCLGAHTPASPDGASAGGLKTRGMGGRHAGRIGVMAASGGMDDGVSNLP